MTDRLSDAQIESFIGHEQVSGNRTRAYNGDDPLLVVDVVLDLRDCRAERDALRARVVEVESAMRDWMICVHCEARLRTTPENVANHGRDCPKHPMRAIEAERDSLRMERDAVAAANDDPLAQDLLHAHAMERGAGAWKLDEAFRLMDEARAERDALRADVERLRDALAATWPGIAEAEGFINPGGNITHVHALAKAALAATEGK